MHSLFWRVAPALLSPFLLSPRFTTANKHDDDEGLFRFITRPELRAPKWRVDVTDEAHVSPGYWFVAPFESIDQKSPGHGWIGPHIYDGDGTLIWSGVGITGNWDVLDFKLSNVRGESLMTFLANRDGDGYIMDNAYTIREKVDLGTLGVDSNSREFNSREFNSREFNFIEGGKRAIVMDEGREQATKEQTTAVEWNDNCTALFNGFKELDTTTWEPVFQWSSFDHIGLEESTFLDGGVKRWCTDSWGWDFIHIDSVDKDHEGDYYLSARHTDTIYKISKDDGRVLWRLNGHGAGDFEMGDLRFSRQHNVRFHGFDGTYEFISILDNAHGQDDQHSTHENSRGLMLGLDTRSQPKLASVVSAIEHPDGKGSFAPRRGSYQRLPNGNIFMGWSEQAIQSEHTEDGRLVMKAGMVTPWLGTYRAYKFPFEGRPQEPPAAHSAAYGSESRNSTTTLVHASWNGATEVDQWNLYKTTDTGEPKIPIFEKKRTGFETAMAWDGFASYVIVEALDKDGKVLGETGIIETVALGAGDVSAAVAEEMYWLQELRGENHGWTLDVYDYAASQSAGYSFIMFLFGAVCSAGVFLFIRRMRGKELFPTPKVSRYEAVDEEEMGELHDLYRQGSLRSSR